MSGEDEIPFPKGGKAAPGPAFISRAEKAGFPWGGTAKELSAVRNPSEISGLVTVDTWVLNCDRYSPDGRRRNLDNVFIVQRPGKGNGVLLKTIDFTHAFTCGGEITRRLGYLERIRDERIYGLFPEFREYLDRQQVRMLTDRLAGFTEAVAKEFIGTVPTSWEVTRESRAAWAKLITERAHFLAEFLEQMLWPQLELGGGTE